MRTVHALAAVTVCVAVAGCSQTADGWPENYPSAQSGATAAAQADTKVRVIAPAVITPGVPAPVVIELTSSKATVVVPRLQLSYAGTSASQMPASSWFTVATAAGALTDGRPITPPPGIGRKWTWSGQALEYTLPAVTVNGTTQVALKVSANQGGQATYGTVMAATADGATSATVITGSAPTGVPTPASTGLLTQRMLALPEGDRDPLPPSQAAAPLPGTSLDTWVPAPHAAETVRSSQAQPGVADLVAGMTPAQVDAVQVPPTAHGGSGLDTSGCALNSGSCALSFDVVTDAGTATKTKAIQVGLNMESPSTETFAGTLGVPAATVDGVAVSPTRAGTSLWAYTVASEKFATPGVHKVTLTIPGTGGTYPSDLVALIDQIEEGGRWPGEVGISLADGTITAYTLSPGQLSPQQQLQAKALPLGADGTYQRP